MKKLFIYIPTFNRLQSITTQLNSLLPQIAAHQSRVRLLISDNASDSVDLSSISSIYPFKNISVVRNGCNVGANANILNGFLYCHPDEALWILSDNDIAGPNAVSTILNEMEASEFDLLFQTEHISSSSTNGIYCWEDGWVAPLDSGAGLISKVVYAPGIFAPHVIDGYYYHNTSFPHLAVILSFAKHRKHLRYRKISTVIDPRFWPSDFRTDYTLCRIGMPLLAQLLPREKAVIFCCDWLRVWRDEFLSLAESRRDIFEITYRYLDSLSPETRKLLHRS